MITKLVTGSKSEVGELENAGCVRTTDDGFDIHPQRPATRFDVRAVLDRLATMQSLRRSA